MPMILPSASRMNTGLFSCGNVTPDGLLEDAVVVVVTPLEVVVTVTLEELPPGPVLAVLDTLTLEEPPPVLPALAEPVADALVGVVVALTSPSASAAAHVAARARTTMLRAFFISTSSDH